MTHRAVIERQSDILGGTPVFRGTRVPVRTLLDYLRDGQRLDDFLEDFPSVARQDATSVLDMLTQTILTETYENSAR